MSSCTVSDEPRRSPRDAAWQLPSLLRSAPWCRSEPAEQNRCEPGSVLANAQRANAQLANAQLANAQATSPTPPRGEEEYSAWFRAIARLLLSKASLRVAGRHHRIREVEFYLHSAEHPDPFAHRHPTQRSNARWYFHRAGNSYRGGSYKGLDITFGKPKEYGGVLIRTIETEGRVTNGCSLVVDHILELTEEPSIAALDAQLEGIESSNPKLFIEQVDMTRHQRIWETSRVGLTLARVAQFPQMPQYFVRRYRFLDAPMSIAKGRPELVVAMYEDGLKVPEIVELTGVRDGTVRRWREAYERGRRDRSVVHGSAARKPGSETICMLLGALANTR